MDAFTIVNVFLVIVIFAMGVWAIRIIRELRMKKNNPHISTPEVNINRPNCERCGVSVPIEFLRRNKHYLLVCERCLKVDEEEG